METPETKPTENTNTNQSSTANTGTGTTTDENNTNSTDAVSSTGTRHDSAKSSVGNAK